MRRHDLREMPHQQAAVLVGFAVSMAYPLAGLTLLAVLAVLAHDVPVPSRVPVFRKALS